MLQSTKELKMISDDKLVALSTKHSFWHTDGISDYIKYKSNNKKQIKREIYK